ncbi:MAG: dethiobiotin synthase [Deltaproteobacteria bacterium]|nr:dethiobiotin synthase [Deltaproteobacteria bacterium]
MRRFFVTGTDTGVGKTFITAAIAHRARLAGRRVFAFKPIESGCGFDATGHLVGADQEALSHAAGNWQQGVLRGVYQFAFAAAPSVAAGTTTIDLERIQQVAREGSERADLVLIEGAGGWRVPVTDSVDMGGLARQLDCAVILVARAGLGTINHSLLTAEAIQRDGCSLDAIVISRNPQDDLAFTRSNAEQIQRRCSMPVLVFDSASESVLDRFI